MTPNALVIADLDPNIREQADAILSELGLTTAEACRIFLNRIVEGGALPFELDRIPNQETIEAMEELESGGGIEFSSMEELFKDLGI
ncbi:MAG: type II toxin-antitoxin system RelB/DinJ family antitoxin [Deltaproteobacteria bacterium]|jgi:DNA-damage-inducible protein J|nr:type II toxin-antitoxin system RelB/DinJ family antitoxin [Deltaproteobacteria bacterium]